MVEGTVIGQYRVLRKIGEGGMGAVFLAEHALIGRRAAIKVLLPGLSVQREIVDRFFNEARATTAISDPGIVQVFDFGVHHDGSAYIVMEFLEGEPLDARMKKLGRLTAYDSLRIIRQAAGSLAAAHARGIVHRDLKPENIFLVPDPEAQGGERPKILDFGIAKLSGNEPGQMRTRTGALMGTPVYMSPEQCRGAGHVDHRSDIYSLGCVLFHMITGRPPFEAEGVGEIIAAHLREPPRPPSAIVPGIPEGVDQLLLACLAKPVEQRLPQMQDLQRACDALMSRITATGTQGPTLAIATPVPPGFRSEYPGVGHAALQHPGTQPGMILVHGNPSQPGTVVLTGTPTTLGTASGEARGTVAGGGGRRWGLIAVLVLLFAGAGVGVGVVLGVGKGSSSSDTGAAKGTDEEPEGSASGTATSDGSGSASGSTAIGSGSASGSGSGSGSAVTASSPDAGVTTPINVTPPDAGTGAGSGVAINDGSGNGSASGSGSGSAKKKKKKKKTGSGSGSEEDLYGDR